MSEHNTILAILELDTEPDRLVERSAWLARAFECDVHLVLFEPESGVLSHLFSFSTEIDALRREIQRGQERIVEEYADRIRTSGLTVTTSVLHLRPLGDHILALTELLQPKLVVKATRYHNIAERSVVVDVDWQLMRICAYPLWLVKAESMPEKPVIVAAVDPGHANDKPAALDREIVASANAVAAATDGDVQLVHTYELLSGLGDAATWAVKARKLPIDEIEEKMTNEHRAALTKIATEHGIDDDRTHLLPGRSTELLPAFARESGAGVFVMGALSRWGFKKLVVGSTAERIIDHLPCDTLIIRLGEHQLGD